MTLSRHRRPLVGALAAVTVLGLGACASNDATATPQPSGSAGGSAGTVPAGQPDVNGDGKVVIGVLSPGDINDKGYYQSFVDGAEAFASSKGWTVIKRGNVAVTDALNAARALCQQKVDMVALGASELKDAIPASEEAVCAKTAWYVPSSYNIEQTPKIVLSKDDPNQSILAAGYATGLLMQARGDTKAGFVTGAEADFSKASAAAFKAGIRMVLPNATVVNTFTGDFNDSAKAKEAVQAQMSQGVKAVYPYLGGATDAATAQANTGNLITLTPGTDRCASTSPKFDISVIFDPGQYFAAALQLFADGKLTMGVAKEWQLGVDQYPTIKICNGTAEQNAKLATLMSDIGSKKVDVAAEVKRLGS
ncbi:BMP family ABC transporter substrate-binding protein [Micromonospora echinofusca]|uniref:BMP family ABC transporter substrate-binding protein n=1 Tax=Micromonospora echinofusca TaxID=47858 RepID=A0ABS3VW57_MICEH|nr:BMP family ABC transporter substrate-binding protein [Micromonospora echinofusca]MBO4208733.1 BMP family ABC transporter substrate-binding protein [Micromonospora echinofusca]